MPGKSLYLLLQPIRSRQIARPIRAHTVYPRSIVQDDGVPTKSKADTVRLCGRHRLFAACTTPSFGSEQPTIWERYFLLGTRTYIVKILYSCEVTLGVIPASLRRFAYDARSRCHSLVWLISDGDSSFIHFLARWTAKPGARASP